MVISVPCCGRPLAPADVAAPGAMGGGCPGGIGGTPMGGQPGNMTGPAEIKNKDNQVNDLAHHESPYSAVVRASDRCVEGHGFDSHRGLRFVLCPMLVTN